MTKLKEAALNYAQKGWPVFPCGVNKAPLTPNGFHDATTNAEIISAWWDKFPDANIGFSPGHAGLMVVDFDPGHDPAFRQSLDVKTLSQRTPRGGEHLFFALGASETAKSSTSRVADHVDIRSHGGYVLLAPSRTKDGSYEWSNEGKPAYRSDDLLRRTNSAREKHPERDNWVIQPDLPENISRAVKWLENDARPAIEGHTGDANTLGAAMMLRSLGVSEETAVTMMLEHYNPRCDPPWEEDGMALKVRNAYAFANGQPGELTQAFRQANLRDMFQPVALPLVDKEAATLKPARASRYRIASRAEMDLIEPPEWLIPDCLPKGGFAMLFGPFGTFKSFVAIDMALSIATGATFPWDGMWGRINSPGPVAFVLGEGRTHITARVRAWEEKHWGGQRVPEDMFFIVDPVPRAKEVEGDDFRDFLTQLLARSPGGYRLVVIDTVSRAMQAINENSQEHASKFTMMVEQMQKHLGCAVLAIHHTGWSNQERAKGAVTFGADCDTVLRVDREDKSSILTLTMTKQKDAAEWEHPRLMEAYEYTVDGVKSLAVGLPSEASLALHKAASETEGANEAVSMEIIEQAVERALKSNTSMAWSQKLLAAKVACDDRIDISGKALENRYLTTLRETSGSRASRWYDPMTNKWRISAGEGLK